MCFTLVLIPAVILSKFFLLSGGGWYQQGNRHPLKFVHPNAFGIIKKAPRCIPLCNAVRACKWLLLNIFS